jgi:hypothetical protein
MLIYKQGFLIRKKEDIHEYLKGVCRNSKEVIKITNNEIYIVEKFKDGTFVLYHKLGNIYDMFNPLVQIPEENVNDVIWKVRKYINARLKRY